MIVERDLQTGPDSLSRSAGPVPLAHVTRGGEVESVHYGTIAVVNQAGEIEARAGNPDTFAYFRSSAKPLQAVSLIESGAADAFGFTPAELALCCASHLGSPMHQTQVAGMLSRIGLSTDALQCGCPLPADVSEMAKVRAGLIDPSPLHCDCSGKHTGMLATCVHLGYAIDTYLEREHSLQQQILANVAELMQVEPTSVQIAVDGCSVPTFGASIAAFATSYATLARPDTAATPHAEALIRLRDAMMAHPENISGKGNFVTDLMEAAGGRIVAKTGAEGLICLGIPSEGLGIAIRLADGTFRSQPAIVASTLRQLGLMDEAFYAEVERRHPPEIRNHNGWVVGEHRAVFDLNRAA